MSSCSSIDPLVTPYVDGELPPAERALVDAHLQRCAQCRTRVDAERTVCRVLHNRRTELLGECAPRALLSRCRGAGAGEAHAGARRSVPPIRRFGPSVRWALAATLVLAVGSALAYRASIGATQALAAELTADHVKCLMLNTVLRTHDDAAAVRDAMRSRFGWPVELPDAERGGLELVGSRPCLYEHGTVAHLMYRHHGVPVSVFMLPGVTRSADVAKAFGHDAVVWSDASRTFVLIAKAPRAEVDEVVSFVRTSLR